MSTTAFLDKVPLFRGLPKQHLEELAMIATEQEYQRGQEIFAEGDEATGLFIVSSGQVKISKISAEGKEQILHIFGPYEPFAEAAVFTGSSYPAYATALCPSRVVFIPRAGFLELLKANPELSMNLLATLSKRLKHFSRMIEDLSLKEVPGRLAAHLLLLDAQQGGGGTVRLPVAKSQLAGLLGTIPETLSRILQRMAAAGLIRVQGPEIELLDLERLRDLAQGEKL